MARSKRIPQPSTRIISQRPRLAAEASRSNCGSADMLGACREPRGIDEFDAQNDWLARIDAGLIKVTR